MPKRPRPRNPYRTFEPHNSEAGAVRAMCAITGLVYASVGNYSRPSDCFCSPATRTMPYQNDGHVIAYIRRAVLRALKDDGFKVSDQYDPKTGKEIR